MARARNLPRTEQRITEVLRDQVVIVTPADVDAVLLAARVATRLSAALAVELDRTATILGHQPQPGLVAALARLQPARSTERDADWAHTVALHPAMHPACTRQRSRASPAAHRGAGAGVTLRRLNGPAGPRARSPTTKLRVSAACTRVSYGVSVRPNPNRTHRPAHDQHTDWPGCAR